MSNQNINYYFKFIKEINDEFVTYNYCSRYYTRSEEGEFKLFGFNGTEDDIEIYVNENNYQQVYVMNLAGKTIDSYRVDR